jgi:hypothetical protein
MKMLIKDKLSTVLSAISELEGSSPIQAKAADIFEAKFTDFVEKFEKNLRARYAADWKKQLKKVSKHWNSPHGLYFTRNTIVDFMTLTSGSDVDTKFHQQFSTYLSQNLETLQHLVMRIEPYAVSSSVQSIERRYEYDLLRML